MTSAIAGGSVKRIGSAITLLFAIVGVVATYKWIRESAARPHHFAKPYSFLILDIENPKDPQAAIRIYLDSPSSSDDVRFEGSKLSHLYVGRPHPQAQVPLPGYLLSGEGRVIFGSAVLDIKNGEVELNGLNLCRREIVLSRSGDSWQGMLRIAH